MDISKFIIVTDTSLVLDFYDTSYDTSLIFPPIKSQIVEILRTNHIRLPEDWYLYFRACYSNGKIPLVSKNKIGSLPSDKMKNITIVIPIPLLSEVNWGVYNNQHVYGKDHYDKIMNNFWELDISFKDFQNKSDYVKACMIAGIRKSFEEGFSVGGVKVKVKKLLEI